MIPLILFMLFKNMFRQTASRRSSVNGKRPNVLNNRILLFLLCCLLSTGVHPQERVFSYDVIHNGDKKGILSVYQEVKGSLVHIKIVSEVKVRMLFAVTVASFEEALFQDGILICSSVKRKVNGHVNVDQQIKAMGTTYQVANKNEEPGTPVYPIRYSILSLYYQEPVKVTSVYAEAFRKYIEIKKVDSNRYKVELPNGNCNYYTYKDGRCIRVEVTQSFYDLQFVFNNNL